MFLDYNVEEYTDKDYNTYSDMQNTLDNMLMNSANTGSNPNNISDGLQPIQNKSTPGR